MKKYLSIFLAFMLINCNFSMALVCDDFANQTLDKNLKIKEYKPELFKDELINRSFVLKHKNEKYFSPIALTKDDFADLTLSQYKNQKFITYVPVDFTKLEKITLKISPTNYITTRNKNLKEGEKIEFILAQDLNLNNKFYKKGTKLNARIENISLNRAYGFPAQLEVGEFSINNTKLDGFLVQKGANRALWVLPSAYIGNLFFGAGLLIYPIRGGHAKLKQQKTYTLNINNLN